MQGVQLSLPYAPGRALVVVKHNGAAAHGMRTNGSGPPPAVLQRIEPVIDQSKKPAPPVRSRNLGRAATGVMLAFTGIALAAGGLAMTTTYMITAATGLDRILLGGLAAGSDVLALLTPSAAAYLWRARRRMPAVIAGVLWVISATTTFQNLCGFVGTYGDNFRRRPASGEHPTDHAVRAARPVAQRAEADQRNPIGRRNHHRNPQRNSKKNRR